MSEANLHLVEPVEARRPLAVDLDGTLLRSDCLFESLFGLLRQQPLAVLRLPLWLARGKAFFKARIAERVDLDVATLPYNTSLLAELKRQRERRECIVLATASNRRYAEQIAAHLEVFDDVMASDESLNLAGGAKRDQLVARFGAGGFDYAGNSRDDLVVWAAAGDAILVDPPAGLAEEARRQANVAEVHPGPPGPEIRQRLVRAMRPHQWLKNLLLFVPLLMAHQLGDALSFSRAVAAFLSFGLCASSVYLLNDLLDLPEDRRHPSKRNRPFAAGTLPIRYGAIGVPVLLVCAFTIAAFLPWQFLGMLAVYYVSTLAYSLLLKQIALVDVLLLAGLYTIRIIAGAAAVAVPLSFWLLAFSMFFFLSLAMVKRVVELRTLERNDQQHAAGRGYSTADLDVLSQFGNSSGFVAVLVLALYINSDGVQRMYAQPELIWLLCPIVLYLIMRVWLLARRDELHDDPVVFVMRDAQSLALAVAGAVLLWFAI